MHEVNLGSEPNSESVRDAVHVAVVPMVAHKRMFPGEPVIIDGTEVGIVDPFLDVQVMPESRYWCFLSPNTVTGMRHHWSHPLFDGEDVSSEEYLRAFAEEAGMSLSKLEERIRDWIEHDEVWVEVNGEDARDAWYDLGKDGEAKFWMHAKELWGLDQPEKPSWSAPFSCSC